MITGTIFSSGNRSDCIEKDRLLKRLFITLIQQLYSLDSEILSEFNKNQPQTVLKKREW